MESPKKNVAKYSISDHETKPKNKSNKKKDNEKKSKNKNIQKVKRKRIQTFDSSDEEIDSEEEGIVINIFIEFILLIIIY